MSRILVIGGGMMGSCIAAVAAYAGNDVTVVQPSEKGSESLPGRIAEVSAELLENGLLTQEQAARAQSAVTALADLDAYEGQPSLVIEAVTEDLALKQQLFARMDALFDPSVPITSNTSGLRITDIARDMVHKERAMTTHFWFPAHLVPLVEVVMSEDTDPAMARDVYDTLKSWGKAPVLVRKDLPGQLANRIFQAVIREATSIVENGIADPEDVDTAVKMGMGIRFPVWGPLEHVDAVGLTLCASVQDNVLPSISAAQEAAPIFREKLAAGESGAKAGKGFYDWTVKDMAALERKRNDFIIQAVKFMRAH